MLHRMQCFCRLWRDVSGGEEGGERGSSVVSLTRGRDVEEAIGKRAVGVHLCVSVRVSAYIHCVG